MSGQMDLNRLWKEQFHLVEDSRWATRDGWIHLAAAAAARVATLVPVPWVGLAADTTTMTTPGIVPPPKRDDNDDSRRSIYLESIASVVVAAPAAAVSLVSPSRIATTPW